MKIEYPDINCPKCKVGYLIAHTGENNIVLKNLCSECDYLNNVRRMGIFTRIKQKFWGK